jgi:hypothetical protein
MAVYTMKPEDLAAFRSGPKSEQEAIDKVGLKAWKEWDKRNAAASVATDVMVGKTRRVTKTGIADAKNQIAGFLIIEAADIAAAAGLFHDHPHITIFPGDGIDVMPVVTGPPRGLVDMKQTARSAANWRRVYAMPVASVYPSYVAKAEKKGRTRAEVDEIVRWLTGYSQVSLEAEFAKTSFEDFFTHAPKMNASRFLMTAWCAASASRRFKSR